MKDTKEIQKELSRFAKSVIRQSKQKLGRSNLAKSLKSKVKVSDNSMELTFLMEDYGGFVDEGVKGKNPSKVSPNAKIRGQQAPRSKYRFGTGSSRGTMRSFAKKMSLFARQKGLTFKNGKTDYDAMGWVVAKNIYYRGLKPTLFFTKPFQKEFRKLPDSIIAKYGLDMEKWLNEIKF